ncbi:MAG: glycosyltransferase family 4 protein [Synergistaceae bacterium]|jgi:glycosyltransferase involved in cell wall biosynthesis|nr:glycosyltransferase family 4 protein [Synergistaceae bacterium]
MRVLYDHTIFRHKYGGIVKYFCEIIPRLAMYEDVDVNLFMGIFFNRYGLKRHRGRCENFWGYYKPPLISRIGSVRKYIERAAWADFQGRIFPTGDGLYHPTYYNYHDSNVAKKVFTVHDFTHERHHEFFSGDDATRDLKKRAFAAASGLICISESTRRDLLELYDPGPSCRVSVVHHGYSDLSGRRIVRRAVPESPYILFVGSRSGYKNFGRLAEAYASAPDLRNDFMLACLGEPFSREERTMLEDLGVAGRAVAMSGGEDVLATLYKKARVFVYPSLYEGFGLPLLEAMSCSCPVAASNTSSFPEVAGDAAVTFDPGSAESIRDSLRTAAYDEAKRSVMIAAGHARCGMFSWDRCADETRKFYRAVLGG